MSKIMSDYDFTKIPFDDVQSVGQISMLYRDLFNVSWILGRFCNYHCSYCWEHGRSDNKDHRTFEVCTQTIDSIKSQARDRGFNSFHFSLSGGEPTMHPQYLDIVKYLADDVPNCNWHSIHMTTNLSKSKAFLKKYARIVSKFHRASVTASFHAEEANKESFIEKLIMLQEYDVHITINMVMVPENFDRDWDNAMYFHNKGLNVTLKPQSDPHANFIVQGYTDEQLKILHNGMPQLDYTAKREKNIRINRPKYKFPRPEHLNDAPKNMQIEFTDSKNKKWYMDQAERFNAFNYNNFKGWECSSGFRSIIIREPDGAIKRSYSCIDEPIGYLGQDFKLFEKPKVCISPSCVSSADSKIPKRKPGSQIPLFPGDKTYEN